MRALAIGVLALITTVCVLGAIAAALGVAWSWPNFDAEPEDLYAAALSLVTLLLLGAVSGGALLRHVRPRRTNPAWWEIILAGLAFTAGATLIWLGLNPTELDRVLFQFLGAAFLLSACMLLLKPQPHDRAS